MLKFVLTLAAATALFAADGPRRAPGFALPDGKMKVYDLYDYRGKPVLLEFISTSCPHCLAFSGTIDKARKKYGDRFQVIAVTNPPDNLNNVNQFIAAHKIDYPVLFDSGQAAYSYILSGKFDLPQVFLIDSQGMIYKQFGYGPSTQDFFEGDGLITELDRLFGPAKPPAAAPKKK